MSKKFNVSYLINLAIILAGLLTPIIKLAISRSPSSELLANYYATLTLLSVTFCISFFGLNLYGAFKHEAYRARYSVISILLFTWIAWGSWQIAYRYLHDVIL